MSYRMGALEIDFEEEEHITVLGYHRFGPRENKDNWVVSIVPNELQKVQLENLGNLGIEISDTKYPVALSIRVNGRVQLAPFGAWEDIFRVTDMEWEAICKRKAYTY